MNTTTIPAGEIDYSIPFNVGDKNYPPNVTAVRYTNKYPGDTVVESYGSYTHYMTVERTGPVTKKLLKEAVLERKNCHEMCFMGLHVLRYNDSEVVLVWREDKMN